MGNNYKQIISLTELACLKFTKVRLQIPNQYTLTNQYVVQYFQNFCDQYKDHMKPLIPSIGTQNIPTDKIDSYISYMVLTA
ncbi:unnamed protein product (macronuclear) [Paramecium tetraurelia]|uniref:Uncharacterized protein n=1 Tax=Paramecium tetraurelia TaxID=5888 RepID=A0CZ12_PARTE|nr:uncharacterized protein GSPATT00011630001 [Paramecium tetraurelia]CAK76029.1 unnamed protein product [Paramecium tetraurelia]|eukprot:XP_001443426.1 hypothetical protein (macronuclear) [Paramecium tetraurelia strain d4-2]